MRRAAPLVLVLGCALPVKVGALDEGTEPGTSTFATVGPTESTTDPQESSSSGPDDPPPTIRHDYAIRFADLPDVDVGESDASASDVGGTDTGSPFDPDSLAITASIGVDTCDDPYGGLPCPNTWKVGFNLPPELQVVGATGSLEDHNGFAFESGELHPEGDCSGGGGSLLGKFEITAIDATHVAGRLTELELQPFDETELAFDAARCG